MKKYKTREGDDLGSIAARAGMVSWKYQYDLNKDTIGDNPDLLKPGTILNIPSWHSTSGDEKIEDKGASAFAYTGGPRYRYPWVPFSVSLVDEDGYTLLASHEEECAYMIRDKKRDAVLHEGTFKGADEIAALIPDSRSARLGIKGTPLTIGGVLHVHPDDEVKPRRTT